MTDAQLLLFAWIPTTTLGVAVALLLMIHAAEDRVFLRTLNLNGVRSLLVDVNFSEAASKFLFKFVYGVAGLWAFVLRVQNPTPVTSAGWVTFSVLFLPILWFTITDVYNYRRKQMIIQGLVKDNIEYVKVQVPDGTHEVIHTQSNMIDIQSDLSSHQ